jgi:4-hydroxyproline epimerase
MNRPAGERIAFIDSHTEGEPTRVILGGAPDLGGGPLPARAARLREHDWFRRCVVLEPRGGEALVAAVLCEPEDPRHAAGVVFMNNVGLLGMCGHGAIGVAVTLHAVGRLGPGRHGLETPVGVVEVELLDPNRAAVGNVPSYRLAAGIAVDVPELGRVTGDVAWGGNWFFLADSAPCPLVPRNLPQLAAAAGRVRRALAAAGVTGADGAEIDHVEFFAPSPTPGVDSRNFVLCPGDAFDRSPCGTGTSAKLACLAAEGRLVPGDIWVQESVLGGRFEASYRHGHDGTVLPRIVGRAFLCGEGSLIRQPGDPFASGPPRHADREGDR